ncbi:MAG: glycosyltransferase family 39 protein [Planctomycetes bacterium]|nr:glycosyltransferase family 39 protein [Planctomycetota bacterium]
MAHLFRSKRIHAALVVVILVVAMWLKLRNLGHPELVYYDESFHALVARNLIDDPFRPVLHQKPWLPYDYTNWRENHVWLHKGTLPLWTMAASMAALGTTTFALRLPSVILATASVWLTWLIGRRTVGRNAALIAATIQAITHGLAQMAHGYWFSDHVDTMLLFWIEVGMYAVVRAMTDHRARWPMVTGFACGCAFLSKSYPGLIVLAVMTGMIVIVGLSRFSRRRGRGVEDDSQSRIGIRELAIAFLAFIVTAAPWTAWCAIKFPREFWHELSHVGRHLTEDVEAWAAPWDRVLFDYCVIIYQAFYPIVIVATGLAVIRFIRFRSARRAFLLLWSFGVLVPFLLATTKTPTATIIAVPAFLLLTSNVFARALAGRGPDTLLVAAAAIMALAYPIQAHEVGQGQPTTPGFGVIMKQNHWVLVQLAGIVLFGWAANAALRRARRPKGAILLARAVSLLGLVGMGGVHAWLTWRVGQPHLWEQSYYAVGETIRTRLPANAALIVDRRYLGEDIVLEFFAGRTCYPLDDKAGARVEELRAAGAEPFVLSTAGQRLVPLLMERPDGWTIYECKQAP